MPKKNPQFEVYENALGEWRWRLRSRNGEIVAQGENYTSAKNARRGVAAVKRTVARIVAAEAK